MKVYFVSDDGIESLLQEGFESLNYFPNVGDIVDFHTIMTNSKFEVEKRKFDYSMAYGEIESVTLYLKPCMDKNY